jgi:hypothetical protein
MLGRRTLGAGMTCQFHTLGLFVYEPSLQMGRIDASLGWGGRGLIAPNSVEAEPRYRQSHERGRYPKG